MNIQAKIDKIIQNLQNKFIDIDDYEMQYKEQLQSNIDELKSNFSGNVNIIVNDAVPGPMTIVGASDVVNVRKLLYSGDFDELVKVYKGFANVLFGLKLKIQNSGDVFHVNSNHQVNVYLPEWFINEYNTKEVTSTVLHEIGHWDTTGAYFVLFRMLSFFIGFFIIIYGGITSISNLFKFKINNIDKTDKEINDSIKKENKKTKKSLYKSLIILLIGIFLYFVMSNMFLSFAENIADSYARDYGYGKELADVLRSLHGGRIEDADWSLRNFTDIFEEFRNRISEGYPSFNWRIHGLLESDYLLESDQSYIIENKDIINIENFISTKILNPLVLKIEKLVFKLKPIKINRMKRINRKVYESNINYNIQLLISEIETSNNKKIADRSLRYINLKYFYSFFI